MSDADSSPGRPSADETADPARLHHSLLERICSDQVERRLAGERVPAEDYLRRHPALRNNDDSAFELIYGEYVLRESLGECPQPEEYYPCFPEFAARLRRQLDLHVVFQSSAEEDAAALGEERSQEEKTETTAPTIPGYEVLGELGRGGAGVVYKARHTQLNRLVAIKVIRSETAGGSEGLARFAAEAQAVARFQHANIVQIFEIGRHADLQYLALEYVPGGNLQQRLAATPQAAQPSAQLLATVARAIHYAHQHGVIHRDLKPANILLQLADSSFREPTNLQAVLPKIADFGLAKLQERDDGLTLTGTILGTPSYMAPEQAWGGAGTVTAATDVYALGTILYEMLTGHPPFKGSTPLSTLEQVRSQEPLAPSRLQRHVPRDLETICLKCLEKEPRKRYPSAQELAEDLERFAQGRPIQARRAGKVERLWRWCRREPVKAALSAALVLVLVGGIAGVVSQWLRAEDQASRRSRGTAAGRERRERGPRQSLLQLDCPGPA